MAKQHSLDAVAAIRLTPSMTKRADRLIKKIQSDPVILATGKVTRSTVLRLCIQKGLDIMEESYGMKK